jgi:hypothetical protein
MFPPLSWQIAPRFEEFARAAQHVRAPGGGARRKMKIVVADWKERQSLASL